MVAMKKVPRKCSPCVSPRVRPAMDKHLVYSKIALTWWTFIICRYACSQPGSFRSLRLVYLQRVRFVSNTSPYFYYFAIYYYFSLSCFSFTYYTLQIYFRDTLYINKNMYCYFAARTSTGVYFTNIQVSF